MSPEIVLAPFTHPWKVEVLEKPPLIAPQRQFVYPYNVPGEEDALHRGALYLLVRPAEGTVFLATCALGFGNPTLPSGVWSTPTPNRLLAVAGGYAYWINTAAPEQNELLEQRPVTALLPVPEQQLLLLVGFHTLLALGPNGVAWQTGRLSWEGVTLGKVEAGTLHGNGWDMFADREVPFTVDLATGAHTGGGYRRS